MAKNNTVYYLLAAAAAVLLFRKQLGIGKLFEGQAPQGYSKRFEYRSKGMPRRVVTDEQIMDTDYWPNEIDNKGKTIIDFVFNSNIMDKWQTDLETITRIK